MTRCLVNDVCTDKFQRCLATMLRRFVRGSEAVYIVIIPLMGQRLLVPREGGRELELMEKKNLLALVRHMPDVFCSHCRVRRVHSYYVGVVCATRRSVVETL